MAGNALPQIHLIWNQSEHYWICVTPHADDRARAAAAMETLNLPVKAAGGALVARAPRLWGEAWSRLMAAEGDSGLWDRARFCVLPGGEFPVPQQIELNERPREKIGRLASSLWLGRALLEGRVACHLQPVIDRRGKVFGYESFARVTEAGGAEISGGMIFEAGAGMQIEYALDRYLHVHSIRSFIDTDLSGALFINFVPGFIHRPEKYLEGLSGAAQALGLAARHIVLDVTRADKAFEAVHLRGIMDYCLSKGYGVALDDVDGVDAARRLLDIGKPDYMKLDMRLARHIGMTETQRVVERLVELARNAGCTVIAEGVESAAAHAALMQAGVDLFQGYYFSPPAEAGKAARKDAG